MQIYLIAAKITQDRLYTITNNAKSLTPLKESNEPISKFTPYTGKIRKSGTGGIYQINDHLYEGRYTPTNAQGKREVAPTREEVEPLLEQMIEEVRERIRGEKEGLKAGENYTA